MAYLKQGHQTEHPTAMKVKLALKGPRLCLLGVVAVIAMLDIAPSLPAAESTPQLLPGSTFTIHFPELPRTMSDLLETNGVKAMMTVFLPRNYDRQNQHPLLLFLGGGAGGRGQNPMVARKLAEDQDFICVDLPLFKNQARGNAPTTMRLDDADFKYMWSLHKVMLSKLSQVVPNIDPAHSVLGGFSNGGHATAGLIKQSDGEVLKMFAAFVFVEGGGRLKQFALLKNRPVLLAYGSKSTSQSRIQEIEQSDKFAGVKIVIHEMKGVGHAFPESEYPAVREWLHNVVLKQKL